METRKYNEQVYMPNVPAARLVLNYGQHALEAAYYERLADLTPFLPDVISTTEVRIVELETVRNAAGKFRVEKMVLRFGITRELDLCLVVVPCPRGWFVKTVWANRKTDAHRTLKNRHLFETGPRP